ncbi:catenin alpha-3-like isoform X4 [Narcine bancroftii]|uniref:catenin alpha-3-like isoform X4 n=1 Tax=Narcine bancroftii TaxID=1343680 RepID=UPI0038322DE5
MSAVALNVPLKMDSEDLQIQTFTVERLIQPLILQVTTLVNCVRDPSKNKKGQSKKAHVLLASVEEATKNLIEKGDQIAQDSSFLKAELTEAVQDVRREGERMHVTSKEFTDDPCALAKREDMVGAARQLLTAVCRLLILADMLDVVHLLQHLEAVQMSFASLTDVTSEDDLNRAYRRFWQDLAKLDFLTQKRQQNAIVTDPLEDQEDKLRPLLEKRLEGIVSEAALMADSSCTRDQHREHIITECNAVRQALQDLLLEYMNNAGSEEPSNAMNSAIENMLKKVKQLRRQLQKAIIDHVSDSFLDITVPLLVLIEAAKGGNKKDIKEYAALFREHASKLVEVANLACSMSTNKEGINIIQMAGHRIETMCPQVINAALALTSSPNSQSLRCNMEMYKQAWETHIHLLTEAVDDVIRIDEFLAISESHILEDVNNCIISLRENDVESLDRIAGVIQGRAARIAHIVSCEMENYEPGVYTEKVMKTVQSLEAFAVPEFVSRVNIVLEKLSFDSRSQFDDSDFVEASRKVYDAVHDIRGAVLMIRAPEELEDMSDLEDDHEALSHTSVQTEGKSDQSRMTELPEEEKVKITEQVADFKKVKSRLDAEIEIWDESSNDIIVLAKKMCMILMEMTDFTRGRGPLRSTSDVINAAKTISDCGNRMDVLVRRIAKQCQDQSCKQDLCAYLEQIKLFSHQLKVCSKVKAEIQNLSGELIVSTLDSITSLILAAKNLMNTVVDTVKMSYIASTKIIRLQSPLGAHPSVVMWRMKVPEKKPLIKREKVEELTAVVRRGSTKKKIHPVKAMSEFRERNNPEGHN